MLVKLQKVVSQLFMDSIAQLGAVDIEAVRFLPQSRQLLVEAGLSALPLYFALALERFGLVTMFSFSPLPLVLSPTSLLCFIRVPTHLPKNMVTQLEEIGRATSI